VGEFAVTKLSPDFRAISSNRILGDDNPLEASIDAGDFQPRTGRGKSELPAVINPDLRKSRRIMLSLPCACGSWIIDDIGALRRNLEPVLN
jgi:hypothetical protein